MDNEENNIVVRTPEVLVRTPSSPAQDSKPVAKRGRPRKSDIAAKKQGNRGKVGRPAGDAARIQELKARLLATTGDKVINKIIEIALKDDHPGQMAALKMCFDRQLPLSLFEKDAKRGSNAVTINIVGVGQTTISGQEDDGVIDMEEE